MLKKLLGVSYRMFLGAISLAIIVGVPTGVLLGLQALLTTFNLSISTIAFSFFGCLATYYLGDATVEAIQDFKNARRSNKAFRKGMVSNDR